MFTSTTLGASALTVSAASFLIAEGAIAHTTNAADREPPNPPRSEKPNQVRHRLFGNLATVQATIRQLHKLGYAEPNDWSKPISTGRGPEVVAILTKRMAM